MSKITKKDNKEFKRSLKNFKNESDIENAYKRIFQKRYIDGNPNATLHNAYGSDGFLRSGDLVLALRMLMEFKQNLDLLKVSSRARIIAQVIYYLKQFELNGEELPNVIFSGDEDEMFVVYAPVLYDYLKKDLDWSIAPSDAWIKNIDLMNQLNNDPNLSTFVFDINTKGFDINDVLNAIDSLVNNDGVMYKIKVTEKNIRIVFDEFVRFIFSRDRKVKVGINPEKQPHLLVSIFINSIIGNPNIYPVPTKRNVLQLPDKSEISIDTNAYGAFFSRYERKYTLSEQDHIKSIADQLIEETSRRFAGDFWTPTIWANRANDIISEVIGDNWRNDYVVWDPACGTKNLTRDYLFDNLYCSTLYQEELDISNDYNQNSKSFQFDFLNDDININPESNPYEIKMPIELFESLKQNKPFIFFANPPYATANNAGAKGTSKKSVAITEINKLMKSNGLGKASQQLYAQFYYRVIKLVEDFNLTNVHIAFFSKSQFMNGGDYWTHFNNKLFSNFKFQKGILFNAGEFSDVSNDWAITFSVYKKRDVMKNDYSKLFPMSVEHLEIDGIVQDRIKVIEEIEQDKFLSEWVRKNTEIKRENMNEPYPRFSSAFNINESMNFRGRLLQESIGYMVSVANNVYKSQRDVFILSGCAYMGNGISITKENFNSIAITFATRKAVRHDWINDMDNFKAPDFREITDIEKDEFISDCIIYSLFNINASYQTSQRDIIYNNQSFDLNNEMFFMGIEDIKKLAEDNYNYDIESQLRFEKGERYVYSLIKTMNISKEATLVYDQAVELLKVSFKYRNLANEDHPEWHVNNWDAGFYQVFKLINEYKIEGFDEFKNSYNDLERKIENKVYKLKMLQK